MGLESWYKSDLLKKQNTRRMHIEIITGFIKFKMS